MAADDEPDDAFGFQPPLPPEDRLWRHPSELGPAGASSPVTIVNRPKVANRVWLIGAASALGGAALTLGLLFGFGAFDQEAPTTPVEKVEISVPDATGPDELAWAEPVLPAIARIDARAASGTQTGTGVVYRSDGLVLTTADAVNGADDIEVTFTDGQTHEADVVGVDNEDDIAVLKVDRVDLPTATIGNAASLELGERTVVISSSVTRPTSPTVGVGLISGLGQRVADTDEQSVLHDMIQANVRLAPDATGSPLVDSSGTVVGIVTRRGVDPASEQEDDGSGPALKVRHATTIEWAKRVADDLVTNGRVRHVWLGVRGANLSEDEVTDLGRGGAKLVSVAPGSPAAEAGLQPGDIVLAVDSRHVTSSSDLVVALRAHAPGEAVAVSYRRGNEMGSTLVTVAERSPAG